MVPITSPIQLSVALGIETVAEHSEIISCKAPICGEIISFIITFCSATTLLPLVSSKDQLTIYSPCSV